MPVPNPFGYYLTMNAALIAGSLALAGTVQASAVDVLARVRAHEYHPVRDGMTYDRTLDRHGVADPNDSDWRVRTLAVRDLVRAGDPDALSAGLTDANPHVRQISAMALGILRVQAAVPAQIRLLQEDAESFVRSQAAVALGQIGDKTALSAVEGARQADRQHDVQHQCELAAYALREGKPATPELARTYAALDEREFDRVHVGDPAPDFALPDTDGKTWRLSDSRGKAPVVLIWVFADWCPVCHHEFHDLIGLREEFARGGIEVATLECHDAYPARVMVGKELEPEYWFSKKPFKQEYTEKIWWPHLIDRAGSVGATYGIHPMAYAVHSEFINRPAVVIVDRDGIVRLAYYGSFWGDRPSIKEILEMLRTQKYDFIHPKRLPPPGAAVSK